MKKKTIITILSILSILFIAIALLCTVFLVNPYFTYINTHTWATVTAEGEITADTDGDFELTQECLKGDAIKVGDVTLLITDISTSGKVELKVQSGNLYDSEGNTVKKFMISLDEQAHFTMDNGTVNFQVISNRYQ